MPLAKRLTPETMHNRALAAPGYRRLFPSHLASHTRVFGYGFATLGIFFRNHIADFELNLVLGLFLLCFFHCYFTSFGLLVRYPAS